MKTQISISLFVLLASSSCLKTRAQLKSDGVPAGEPTRVEAGPASGGYAIDEIKNEITLLEGRLEDLERMQKDSNQPSVKDDIKKLEIRIQELEQSQIALLEAVKKLQADVPPPDPEEALNKAREQYKKEKYDDALENLNLYLKSPSSKRIQEATYLRGEAYFALKKYKKAIVDFSKFPEKFNKSRHMPRALLRIAQSFEAMGMKDDASGFYDQLLEEYPKSPEAKEAHRKPKKRQP